MNLLRPNFLFHVANALLLLGYSMSDVLWLRLLGAASALISIPYFAMQPAPMWLPIGWNVAFIAINLFHSWRLVLRRRTLKLAPVLQFQTARKPQPHVPTASMYPLKIAPSIVVQKNSERWGFH